MKDDVAIRWYAKDRQHALLRRGLEPPSPAMAKAEPAPHVPRWHELNEADPNKDSVVGRLIEGATVQLLVGEQVVAERHLTDLFNDPCPLLIHIPQRQSFRVEVEFSGSGFDSLAKYVGGYEDSCRLPRKPCRIWIKLEGWRLYY